MFKPCFTQYSISDSTMNNQDHHNNDKFIDNSYKLKRLILIRAVVYHPQTNGLVENAKEPSYTDM